ncbi:outer membrane protein [Cohaesibacter celericrescens]|nr:outer membrane protein [Cohaesibacter celericrescens]
MALTSISFLPITTLSGCLIAAIIPASAISADMPSMPGLYSDAGPAPRLTWEGSYMGLQIGAGQMGGEITSTTKTEFDKGGFAGGLYAGHNWQVSNFVLGLEADLTYMGNKKSFSHATLGTVKAQNNWSTSLKGRVGLPIDRFMPYLSAGVTAADYKLTANGVSKTTTNASINLGAGVEYALSDQVHLRADYSLNGLNAMKKNFAGTQVKSEAASHRLMLGVSYSF